MKTFSFTYTKPDILPDPQPLRISLIDQETGQESAQTAPMLVHASADWLSAFPTAGDTVMMVNVELTEAAKMLAAGSYSGQIEVTSANVEVMNSPQIAPVTLKVAEEISIIDPGEPPIEPPIMSVEVQLAPSTFSFTYKKPGNLPTYQTLSISTSATAPVSANDQPPSADVEIYCNADWLDVTPAEGTTPLSITVKLNNNAKKLNPGSYTSEIEVQSSSVSVTNSPQVALVTLQVVAK